MKRISHTAKSQDHLLHIETDLGILNIRVGLTNTKNQPTESFSFIPDEGVKIIPSKHNVRLVRVK